MLIDNVADEVWKKRNTLVSNRDYNPSLVIYMTQDFYHECLMEINAGVSSVAMSFLDNGMILGYPVFAIMDRHMNNHPSFRVVEITC